MSERLPEARVESRGCNPYLYTSCSNDTAIGPQLKQLCLSTCAHTPLRPATILYHKSSLEM